MTFTKRMPATLFRGDFGPVEDVEAEVAWRVDIVTRANGTPFVRTSRTGRWPRITSHEAALSCSVGYSPLCCTSMWYAPRAVARRWAGAIFITLFALPAQEVGPAGNYCHESVVRWAGFSTHRFSH